mgnify:CR=1 FL=1
MPTVVLPERLPIGVTGADAEQLLHNVLTCDITTLPEGVARPGALLTPQGKVMFDFLVGRDGEGFVIDIDAAQADAFLKRMMLYRLRSKVEFDKRDQMVVAASWNGDSAASQSDSTPHLRDERFAAATVTRAHLPAGAEIGETAPLAQWHRLRIDNGVPESGSDFELGDAFGHDISLDQNGGLDFKKGCYVGQEVVSRMQHRGTARRRVVIATGEGPLPAPGTEISAGGKPAGTLGTVVGDRGLAIVRLDRVSNATDKGEPVVAGELPVSLQLPPNVTYGWPDRAGPDAGTHA